MQDSDRNRFVFHFTDSDYEQKGHEVADATYFFFLDADPGKDYSDEHEDDIIDISSDLESDYGVHDWSTTGNPDGTWREIAGYNSYEVRADKWDELMGKWHEWFQSQGWQPGEIQKLSPEEYEKRFYPWVKQREEDNV